MVILLRNDKGFTLIEIILTLTILSLVMVPLMSMVVVSAKINYESNKEYKSFLEAQSYMEEIKNLKDIDTLDYDYKNGIYEKIVTQTDDTFGAKIRIIPENTIYYLIDINIIDNVEIINTLRGSMIVNNK